MRRIRKFIRNRPLLYDVLKRLMGASWNPSEVEWFLDRLERQIGHPARFIQVGANDGLRNDPLRYFVVWRKWTGILVEPLPDVFRLLQRNYSHVPDERVSLVQAAVGPSPGTHLSLWTFDHRALPGLSREEYLELSRKSSFDQELVLRAADATPGAAQAVVEIDVPVVSLVTLAERQWGGRAVDLIAIDAEGYDGEIVRSIDVDRLDPKMILFESHNLDSDDRRETFSFLEHHGYVLHHPGGDTVAARIHL